MLLSRALSILLFSCITTGIASSKNIDNDDEDLSIQPNHPDVEDVVEAPPLAAMVKEAAKAAEVDINSLPLMDWRTVTPKDFWFEVRGEDGQEGGQATLHEQSIHPHRLEIQALALAFIGYYIVNYNSGKAKNKAVARAWYFFRRVAHVVGHLILHLQLFYSKAEMPSRYLERKLQPNWRR